MLKELDIIQNALEKTGLVIVVTSISMSASLNRKRLEYISSNAESLGINPEALKQGYRLIDDYVHPDDRQRFNEAVTMSLSESKNFSYEVRNIGDDGQVRNVNVDIIHLPEKDGLKYLEFVIREVHKPDYTEPTVESAPDKSDTEGNITPEFLAEKHIDDLFNSFANVCELYSVVLDINGHILVPPTGPTPYLGEFHEMVVNPDNKELYGDVVGCIVDSKQAIYSEIDDGNPDSRFIAAPIFMDGRFTAAWIVYAHNKNQNQKLFKAFDSISKTAESISEIITSLYVRSVINEEEENIKTELEFERNAKEVTENVLKIIADGDRSNLDNVYQNVGTLMDVDFIVYFAIDDERPGYYKLIDYWAKNGKSDEAVETFDWESDHYDVELQNKIKEVGLVIDKKNMTNQMRVQIFKGNARAVMVFPLYLSGEYHGRLVFIENSKERIWTEEEISFAKEITKMMSRDLMIEEKLKTKVDASKVVMNIFESIPAMILVRDVESGRVIYTNPSLKLKLGYDIVGQNSFGIIPSLNEEYEGLDMTNKETLYFKTAKYKRYIDKLDGIYDVTEHYLAWKDDEIASVLVINPE
ncbi:MAG: PAS domain-containing protein [Eubacterium sp.]|nr:PAS domain-containing protein [Eubacterium sp.]